MNTQSIASSTIKLNLSSGILKHAQAESERIGISLQDFIRMLMATYFANTSSLRAISPDQRLFERAQREIQKGQYTRVENKEALGKYLDTLQG